MGDPYALFYLIDIYIEKNKFREALTMLAKNLVKYPMMVHLLYKQAQCLVKFHYFEYAVKIAKVCVDLCPTSFEVWLIYAESLIWLKEIGTALIALDLAPCSQDV